MVRVGALRQTQREDTQPSKNDPASGSLFAVAQRFAAFCSNVTSLFSTATHDGSEYARVYLHGLMQARHRAKNMDRMEEAVNTTAALARWTMDRCGNAQHAAHLARRSWPAVHLPAPPRRASGKLHAVGAALSVRDWAGAQPPAA